MKLSKLAVALSVQALGLSGCYVVPVGPDGNYAIYIPTHPSPTYGGAGPTPVPSTAAPPRAAAGAARAPVSRKRYSPRRPAWSPAR